MRSGFWNTLYLLFFVLMDLSFSPDLVMNNSTPHSMLCWQSGEAFALSKFERGVRIGLAYASSAMCVVGAAWYVLF